MNIFVFELPHSIFRIVAHRSKVLRLIYSFYTVFDSLIIDDIIPMGANFMNSHTSMNRGQKKKRLFLWEEISQWDKWGSALFPPSLRSR